jgi:S1-C subfamily serine protease
MKTLSRIGLCLLMCVTLSCATIPKEGSVRSEIKNIYLSSVTVTNDSGRVIGSGTIINNQVNQQMFVITAAHVVEAILEKKKTPCIMMVSDSKIYAMNVYKLDSKLDLAVLYSTEKMKKSGPSVNISLYGPNIGDEVWVVGAPLGDSHTVTNGIISNFKVMDGKKLYRTTAPVFYGNSGGGMFNSYGDLIGVAHGILTVQIEFSIAHVPGGYYFVGLESIRQFM